MIVTNAQSTEESKVLLLFESKGPEERVTPVFPLPCFLHEGFITQHAWILPDCVQSANSEVIHCVDILYTLSHYATYIATSDAAVVAQDYILMYRTHQQRTSQFKLLQASQPA